MPEETAPVKKKKGKAPAFSFYPDKYIAHTNHLSDKAYRAYHQLLCWMWLHSPDQCSIPDTDAAWGTATKMNSGVLKKVRTEIMAEHMPLLKRVKVKGNGIKLISGGLKKEANKQKKRRQQMEKAANKRWDKELQRMHKHTKKDAYASDEPAEDTDTPPDLAAFCKAHPQYAKVIEDPQLRSITPENYLKILQSHPKADEARAVKKALDTTSLMTSGINQPGLFLRKQFSKDEEGKTGSERTSSLPASSEKKTPKGKDKAPF